MGGIVASIVKAIVGAILGAGITVWKENKRDARLLELGHSATEIARLKKEREIMRRARAIEGSTPADLRNALADL